MSWKTVYIDENCHISNQLDNLKIRIEDEFIRIPISDLQLVIFAHDKLTITLPLINKLIENNVGIVTTNKSKDPIGMFLPFNNHSLVFKQLKTQIEWNKVKKKQLWKLIIEQKIESEIHTLKRVGFSDDISKLQYFRDNVKSFDTTNREAVAAKCYFSILFGKGFTRDEVNDINFSLNYGYKILASYISRYISSRGYLTQLGIFHCGGGNPYNLTYDFIEIFRYIIDIWVYYNVYLNSEFILLDKQSLLNIMNCKMKYDDKVCRLSNVIELVVNDYFRFLNDEVDSIMFPIYDSIVYETK